MTASGFIRIGVGTAFVVLILLLTATHALGGERTSDSGPRLRVDIHEDEIQVEIVNSSTHSIIVDSDMTEDSFLHKPGLRFHFAEIGGGSVIERPSVQAGLPLTDEVTSVEIPPFRAYGRLFDVESMREIYDLAARCYMLSASYVQTNQKTLTPLRLVAEKPIKLCFKPKS